MECLDPVAYDTFIALKNSFHFYLYHVFIWFGVGVPNSFEIKESEFASTFDKVGGSDRRESIEEKKRREQMDEQKRNTSIAQQKYPILTQMINKVNESLRNRKLAPDLDDLN
eukprot:TRINITY_DN2640_c0_g1_i1.p1 TRINITY_DN2640_c0_g1~~TRINITY_DN2640_c0_g1_i1.p1  ORF type:complete len:112 (-),score=30.25 TRINITY_DN2640_c0_g1_i1:801-1136(-)